MTSLYLKIKIIITVYTFNNVPTMLNVGTLRYVVMSLRHLNKLT